MSDRPALPRDYLDIIDSFREAGVEFDGQLPPAPVARPRPAKTAKKTAKKKTAKQPATKKRGGA